MRMISADSLLTIRSVSRSHSTGTVTRPEKPGSRAQVGLRQEREAVDRVRAVARALA